MSRTDIYPDIKPTHTEGVFPNAHHLQQLLEQDMKGNPTYIGQTLKKITDILNKNGIEFALAGALSLGIRCRPRYTVDIDLLIHPGDYQELEDLFKEHDLSILFKDEYLMTVRDRATGVEADLLFSPFDPEESGRVTATEEEIFGVAVPVIQSEYLLWMYLLSGMEKHKVDGINLIKSDAVDLRKLIFYLNNDEFDEDEESSAMLKQWIAKADKEKSSSYSESVRRRKPPKRKP